MSRKGSYEGIWISKNEFVIGLATRFLTAYQQVQAIQHRNIKSVLNIIPAWSQDLETSDFTMEADSSQRAEKCNAMHEKHIQL